MRLLEEEQVAVVPGNAFGPSGEGHVRACYATSEDRIREALRRIARFVTGLREERNLETLDTYDIGGEGWS
jgi:aminotransferase